MRLEITSLQKDRELLNHWRSEAEKEKAHAVTLLEEKHQLLVKLASSSEEKTALDSGRALLEAEREQVQRERRNAQERVKELDAALQKMTEERDELKEANKSYEETAKAEERRRAKHIRERLSEMGNTSTELLRHKISEDSNASSGEEKHNKEKKLSELGSHDGLHLSREKRKERQKDKEKKDLEEKKKERRKNRRTVHIMRPSADQEEASSSTRKDKKEKKDKHEKKKKSDTKRKEEESHKPDSNSEGAFAEDLSSREQKRSKKLKESSASNLQTDTEIDAQSPASSFSLDFAPLRLSECTEQKPRKRPLQRSEGKHSTGSEEVAISAAASKAGSFVGARKTHLSKVDEVGDDDAIPPL